MRVAIDDNLKDITEGQLAEEIRQLPRWRREQALSFRFHIDRVQCVYAYLLLKRLLHEEYNLTGNPTFAYTACGKPMLKDYPDIHFNLSHCKQGVMCVVSDNPVGCDIEQVMEDVDDALLKHCCNAQEIAQITASPRPALAFTQLWTMKEAVLKFTGEGLTDDLPRLLASEGLAGLKVNTQTCEEKGYVWSIAFNFAQNSIISCGTPTLRRRSPQ